MSENQLLALVSVILVLILVMRGRARNVPRDKILPYIAIWLAVFAALGLFYSLFGPFGNS